jgi:hypothetical protein
MKISFSKSLSVGPQYSIEYHAQIELFCFVRKIYVHKIHGVCEVFKKKYDNMLSDNTMLSDNMLSDNIMVSDNVIR